MTRTIDRVAATEAHAAAARARADEARAAAERAARLAEQLEGKALVAEAEARYERRLAEGR